MLGCVYLILAALLGREIIRNFLPEQRMREKGITPLWVTFAASFGSGVLLMTWAVYIACLLYTSGSDIQSGDVQGAACKPSPCHGISCGFPEYENW